MQPIPYSPIVTRPKLKWPNGARIALWLVPNIEHYEYLPRPNQAKDPWPHMPHLDVLGYSRADYGNRVGFWRMIEVIARYHIPCTVSLNLAVYEHFPEAPAIRVGASRQGEPDFRLPGRDLRSCAHHGRLDRQVDVVRHGARPGWLSRRPLPALRDRRPGIWRVQDGLHGERAGREE